MIPHVFHFVLIERLQKKKKLGGLSKGINEGGFKGASVQNVNMDLRKPRTGPAQSCYSHESKWHLTYINKQPDIMWRVKEGSREKPNISSSSSLDSLSSKARPDSW